MLSPLFPAAAAMPETADLAALLLNARKTGQRLAAIPETGPCDAAQAYAVQQAVWAELAGKQRPSVWKLGASSRQTEPTVAPILPERTAHSTAHYPVGMFHTLGIEAEIAFCFRRDLPARTPPYHRDEILDAIATAHVAMELVDSRLADPEAAGPLWRLADSLLNGALVIGEAIPGWRRLEFSGLTARVVADGICLAETIGRPPLDDLFFCLPWWLTQNGGARAGDIVTTGAWNGMHPVSMPTVASVQFPGLGMVSVQIKD